MEGKPIYKREQKVKFCEYYNDDKLIHYGIVYIIDPNGSFFSEDNEPQYDVMCVAENNYNDCLYKHVNEDNLQPVDDEEFFKNVNKEDFERHENNKLTLREMKNIEEHFKNKPGKDLENQGVKVCGFFSTKENWKKFIDQIPYRDIKLKGISFVKLKNGECWRFFDYRKNYKLHNHWDNLYTEGNGFYKLYIDKDIDSSKFYHEIYCNSYSYCSEIKFIDSDSFEVKNEN